MSIGKNLRALRIEKGMTQEEAAEQVGLTRQAISSYEAERTRPDVEMLTRLAEVYGTDLEGVLYGQSRTQSEMRRLKRAAGAVMVLTLLLTLLRAVLRWLVDRLFHIPLNMSITEETKPLLDAHFALLDASVTVEELASAVLLIGGIVLLVLMWIQKRPLAARWKLCYAAAMAAVMAVCTLPFAWTDRLYRWGDYMIFLGLMAGRMAVFLLISLLLDLLRKRRRQ